MFRHSATARKAVSPAWQILWSLGELMVRSPQVSAASALAALIRCRGAGQAPIVELWGLSSFANTWERQPNTSSVVAVAPDAVATSGEYLPAHAELLHRKIDL